MNRNCLYGVVVSASAVLAAPAFADHMIDTYPYWDGNITSGWLAVAQSFVAPEHNILVNYKFGFETAGVDINFDIYQWDETSGPVGGSLYSTSFSSLSGDNLVNGINLALTEGTMYAAIVDMNGFVDQSVHFMANVTGNPEGDSSWFNGTWQLLNSGFSTKFMANFREIPAPGTLAAFGLFGLVGARRRHRTA
jgi:hypothetical protein